MGTQWQLGNAEARESETFQIPSREARTSLAPKMLAKLIFEFSPPKHGCSAERMWVEVLEKCKIAAPPSREVYVGILANEPIYISGLKMGTKVVFGPEHVIDVDDGEHERPNEVELKHRSRS